MSAIEKLIGLVDKALHEIDACQPGGRMLVNHFHAATAREMEAAAKEAATEVSAAADKVAALEAKVKKQDEHIASLQADVAALTAAAVASKAVSDMVASATVAAAPV